MADPQATAPAQCEAPDCRQAWLLRARTTLGMVGPCHFAWSIAVQPSATPQQVHEAQLATRERMTARGGTDRHLVRTGKS